MQRVPVQSHACCERCTVLLRYARTIADLMRLRDWVVEIGHAPPENPLSRATAEIAEGRLLVRLRFAAGFPVLPLSEQRHAVVHELAHALSHQLYEAVRDGARDEFGGAAYRLYIGTVHRETERLVDVLASVIAPAMPEPEWP